MMTQFNFSALPPRLLSLNRGALSGILVFFWLAVVPSALSAQCDPPAAFTLSQNGCSVQCQPSYNGTGTVLGHSWSFTQGSFTSTTNVPNPLHTFDNGGAPKMIVHTITIQENGQTTVYMCTQVFYMNCSNSCAENSFTYQATGCVVSFAGIIGGAQQWDFGDGNQTNVSNPTHTYAASGDYVVTFQIAGLQCQKTIRVNCDMPSSCCTAGFNGALTRECGVLWLKLKADCPTGNHKWIVSTDPVNYCATLVNFSPTSPEQTVQVTNINTAVIGGLVVRHEYTCGDGTVTTATQTYSTAQLQGIYIGKIGATSSLANDYACVLPGAGYNGSTPVYSSGVVNIDKTFEFASAEVRMHPEAGFDVTAGNTFTLRLNTVLHGIPDLSCNCLWRGINVQSGAALSTSSNAAIEDALYAARAFGGGSLSIRKTNFNRNFVSLRGTDGAFTLSFFEENIVDGAGPLKEICGLAGQNDVLVSPISAAMSVVPYNSERGFAGIYIKEAGALLLPELTYAKQNNFTNLAIGLNVYDTELSVRKNCRFRQILPGAYAASGTQLYGGYAVHYIDTDKQGPNGIRFAGNGKYASNPSPDFSDCTFGVYIVSSVGATPTSGTRISVSNCKMRLMQEGVFLSDNIGIGTFTGYSGHAFRGIYENDIQVNPSIAYTNFVPLAGIFHTDLSSTTSNLEFATNTINVDQDYTGGSDGIRVLGFLGVGESEDFQLNIHRNQINVNQGAVGVNIGNYKRAWVHDHNNNAAPGAGIFINFFHAPHGAGLALTARDGNLLGCNDVTSSVPGTGIRIGFHKNATVVRNNIYNGQYGVVFRGSCTDSRFACNSMNEYSENGLRYESGANTGPQGITIAMTHGNTWTNSNLLLSDAFVDITNTNPTSSPYFVRTLASENPDNNSSGWFTPNVLNSVTPTCYFDCPITSPEGFATPAVSSWDDSVALEVVEYTYYPEASEWWEKRSLFEKLLRSPSLATGNTALQNFVSTYANTALGQLALAAVLIDSLSSISVGNKSILETNAQITDGVMGQLEILDSLMFTSTDPGYPVQRDSLLSILTSTHASSEVVNALLHAQRLGGIGAVLNYLNGIMATNIYEANEKTVLKIYLESVVSDLPPTADMLDTLYDIGSKCPLENGPAVYSARGLHGSFTGSFLPDVDCPEEPAGRSNGNETAPLPGTGGKAWIYPNPASVYLTVGLPGFMPEKRYLLRVSTPLGNEMLVERITAAESRVNTTALPAGMYFIRIDADSQLLLQTTLFLQH